MSVVRFGTSGNDWFTNYPGAGGSPIGFNPGDTLAGGTGDDTYTIFFSPFVYNYFPLPAPPVGIFELPGEGWDTIIFDYTPGLVGAGPYPPMSPPAFLIPDHVEAAGVGVYGAPSYYRIVGNGLDNSIIIQGHLGRLDVNVGLGGAGNDLITAKFRDIRLNGEAGDDTLRLMFHSGGGWEFAAEVIGGTGRDMLIIQSENHHGGIALSLATPGVAQALPNAIGSTVTLSGDIEDLWVSDGGHATLPGGHNDTLTGNGRDNLIIAGGGNDLVNGGGGNDTLHGDSPSDIGVLANARLDAAIGYAGYSFVNTAGRDTLFGGAGNDALVGGNHGDLLVGGTGNDMLWGHYMPRDPALPDRWYSIEDIEGHLRLIDGYLLPSGDGADTLDGGEGVDTMRGATGNDLYKVDNAGDVIIEFAGEGRDMVQSQVSYTLADHVEELALFGTATSGTGNALANKLTGNALDNVLSGLEGADDLFGLDGNDQLDGGAGGDRMRGGRGHDSYVVDDALDLVIEAAGEGTDTVLSLLSTYRLRAEVENLTLGTGALNGQGNALDNLLLGNDAINRLDGGDGADTLVGGLGADRLTGGLGADTLRFLTPGEGGDRITGFVSGEDRIEISAAGFGTGLAVGASMTARFFGATLPAGTGAGVFSYDMAAGRLIWDANGSAAGGRTTLALLDPGTALSATDFIVIA